jgi:hypothetical protein
MTPESALAELLDRMGAGNGASVFVTARELKRWPSPAVESMKARRLLTKARPASSVVCPGCDRQCMMPLETADAGQDRSAMFVVCDKRSDINRVHVTEDELLQWRCDAAALCNFVRERLGLTRGAEGQDDGLWRIGVASGRKREQMLCLRIVGRVELVAGQAAVPLADVIVFRDGDYSLDTDRTRRLVDSSDAGDSHYTPNTLRRELRRQETQKMRERWRKEYRKMLKASPERSDVWYSQKIAKLDPSGRSAETIRKHMKR